ncbi:MAG: N-acetylneuraminate synthase [Phycisphaerae bacterium]|nr:MAG: N-acetylneuraminate synthase [Phycisphaerae bacterium]
MNSNVQIAGKIIGDGHPVFISVEVGTTCNGDLDASLKMIDAAASAGAEAIKFMIIGPEYFMSDRSVVYEYECASGKRHENMFEMFSGLTFTTKEWQAIAARCKERNVIFGATIDYLPGVNLAVELGAEFLKLSSWDTANVPLIRRMAQVGLPLQIDTGPTTAGDIDKMLGWIRAEELQDIVLVHCSHAKEASGVNVKSVPYMKDVFTCPVGYSADDRDQVPDLAAVSLGANLIEKRLTLDRTHEGHHHIKALEPDEFAEWVRTIRRCESLLGSSAIKPSAEDLRQKEMYFVSVVANTNIAAGTTINEKMLACKRPGSGIAPEMLPQIVGRTAKRDIAENELLTWSDV